MRNESRFRPFQDLGMRLLILVLASGLLLAMYRSGQGAVLGQAITRIASPVQWRLFLETNRLARSFQQIARNRLAREEQQHLLARNRQLAAENAVLQEVLQENERLRQQLGYVTANPRFTFQGAHVIGQVLAHEPHSFLDYIVIDAGSDHAIAVGMPVLTPQGLVGRIAAVTPRTARVLLINDVSSSVSGLMQSSRVNGQVVGVAGGGLHMRFITVDDPVAVGESLVTSHLSATLPQGVPIGTVTAIEEQRNSSAVHAVIQPAVDFRYLESVMVVTNFEIVDGVPPLIVAPEAGE